MKIIKTVSILISFLLLSAVNSFAQYSVNLNSPKDPQSGLFYHEASDASLICSSLGFTAGAVYGSIDAMDSRYNNQQTTILVGSSGMRSYQLGYGVSEIQCYTGTGRNTGNTPNPPNSQQGNSIVKITSVNGAYDSNHAQTINVRPGDVITFSADNLNSYTYQPMYSPVENFQWVASDSTSDACDANAAQNCLSYSNFQVNNYGVAFYVPYSMAERVVITVRDRNNAYSYDTITLVNANYNSGYQPVVITDASQYRHSDLNADYALAGQGRWVYINGHRYFVPYSYQHDSDDYWEPYRNGYWSRDAYGSMHWISYDPWGWMTDHYGYWRHHGTYGWIWSPFGGGEFYYHSHCVSWIYSSGYVGWYPYYSSYSSGYNDGYNHGFNDGFWAGYNAANGYGSPGYNYHPGYTVVQINNFTNINIVNVYQHTTINNTVNVTVASAIANARNNGQIRPDLNAQVVSSLGNIPSTTVDRFGSSGNIQAARGINPVPAQYSRVGAEAQGRLNGQGAGQEVGRQTGIGSVIDVRGSAGSSGRVIAPTNDGRGVAAAPIGRDQSGRDGVALPPQTTRPTQINTGNPGSVNRSGDGTVTQPGQPTTRPELPRPDTTPRPQPAPRPDPQPAPRPEQPRPQPAPPRQEPRPQPAPAPQPRPQPAPRPEQPRPQPAPPRQEPRPQPAPAPQPRPQPAPRPEQPRPQPAPPRQEPRPQPAPAPQPRQQPAPRPAPGPGPRPHMSVE